MGRRKGDEIARFWSHVKTGQLDECWIWQGANYGTTSYGQGYYQGRVQGAHRISYQINCGPIPEGMDVCHTCDNPPCVNPAHLWLGTHTDNQRDAARKGRSRNSVGVANPDVKLNDDKVREILHLLKEGYSHREIGERYGVSSVAITYINRGITWKHIPR